MASQREQLVEEYRGILTDSTRQLSKKYRPLENNDTKEQMNTPLKRDNTELEPNTPSPNAKQEGILKIKELELLSHIKRIITEVVHTELQTKVNALGDRIDSNEFDIAEIKTKNEETIVEDNKKFEEIKTELQQKTQENKALKEELLRVEIHNHKLNLKLSNMPDKLNETAQECEKQVLRMLEHCGIPMTPLSITTAYRLGYITKRNPSRPIIVAFHHPKQRSYVLYSGSKIRSLCKVIVEEDHPEEIQMRRKMLMPSFREARKTTRAKLVDDKLMIDGRYNTENLHTLPKHLQPEELATKEKGNMLCFFTFQTAFSNHHRCNLQYRDTEFNSSEQAFMYYKAKLFKDEESAKLIMKSIDPAKQKGLGKHVEGFNGNVWDQNKDRIMYEVVLAKFQNNPLLKKRLLDTGNKTLIECNPSDPYWGIGLGLQETDIWNQSKWKGENKLGQILGIVREELKPYGG